MILGAQPAILWFWYYWQIFQGFSITFFLAFPVAFFVGVITLIFGSTIVAKIFLSFVNLIHKPREGLFDRNKGNKDYCYWSLRAVVRKWPIWLARQLSIPIIEMVVYKILGGKSSFSNSLHDAWVDCEFVEFGKNVKIGQGSIVASNMVIGNKLLIKKVLIKDNVIVGSQSLVSPGTIIEANTILDSISMTFINQHLKADEFYYGTPPKIVEKAPPINDKVTLEKLIFEKKDEERYDEENLRAEKVSLSVPILFYLISGILLMGGSFVLPAYLFIVFLFGFFIPNMFTLPLTIGSLIDLKTLVYLFLTPLIIIGIYLLHMFFLALFTRFLYRYADKRGANEGVFDRNLAETSTALDYYHVRSFLFNYPIYAFLRSPFPWLLNWELRFIGSNKVGKGTVLEESYVHSHINYGNNCYINTFSHITNHLVDGVYGEENLTFFGVEIDDNTVFASLTGGLPGTEAGKNSTILPMGTTIKFDKLQGNGIYAGFPLRKLKKEEVLKFLGGEWDDRE